MMGVGGPNLPVMDMLNPDEAPNCFSVSDVGILLRGCGYREPTPFLQLAVPIYAAIEGNPLLLFPSLFLSLNIFLAFYFSRFSSGHLLLTLLSHLFSLSIWEQAIHSP